MANEKLRTRVALLVVVIWSAAAIDGAVTHDYTGLGITTPVMMLVGGFLFGFRRNGKEG